MSGNDEESSNPCSSDRVPFKKTLGRCFWALYATCYEALTRLQAYRDMHHRVLECLEPRPGAVILDAGCGTGHLVSSILGREPSARVVGLDFTSGMLRIARQRSSGARLLEHDLNRPFPFLGGSFDAIACINVLYSLADPVAVLGEFRRVLRPRGRFVLVNMRAGFNPLEVLLHHLRRTHSVRDWLEVLAHLPHLCAILALNRLGQKTATSHACHFPDLSGLQDWARAAGLEILQMEAVYAGQALLAVMGPGGAEG